MIFIWLTPDLVKHAQCYQQHGGTRLELYVQPRIVRPWSSSGLLAAVAMAGHL